MPVGIAEDRVDDVGYCGVKGRGDHRLLDRGASVLECVVGRSLEICPEGVGQVPLCLGVVVEEAADGLDTDHGQHHSKLIQPQKTLPRPERRRGCRSARAMGPPEVGPTSSSAATK